VWCGNCGNAAAWIACRARLRRGRSWGEEAVYGATVRPAGGPGVTKRQTGAERCGGARKQGVSWGKPATPLAQVKKRENV
jgi:hypothetical protein